MEIEPLLVDVATACKLLGVKRTKLFQMLRIGILERRKAGSKTLVTVVSIRAFAERGAQ